MQDNEKKPALRFKGFTDPWEQRKLTNLCEKFTDGDWIEAKDQSDSGVRLVQTGNVGVTEYLDKPNNKKWISFETFEQLHCEEVYPGDILISRLPEPAGRACIMPNLGTKMITAVDCTIVRPNAVTSTRFLLQYLSSQAYFDAVNTCLAGGTRQRISRGNLAQFNVPIPSSKIEQEKIGEVLEKLDTLITLHQRKYEKLVNIKKSMLDKMFPKNGASVPEIRFKGFTDLWEQRKLGDLCVEFRSGEFISASDITETGEYPVFGGNGLRGFTDRFNHDGEYTLIGRQGALCGNVNFAVGKSYFTEHAIAVRADKKNQTRFLYYLFSTMDLGQYSGQSAQPGLAVGNLVELKSTLPDKQEQEKISGVLTALDTLITLHQRKYEKLVNIKKSMLDKMFPKNGASVPEIRFKGFTDLWEQRKLGDLCVEFRSGEFISASDITETGEYPVFGGNGLRGFTDRFNHDGEYTLIGRQGALCGNVNFAVGKSYFTEHAIAVRADKKNQTRFLYYLFSTMDLGQYSGQSAQPGLAVGNLVELKSTLPDKQEQEKISGVLTALDTLITLHQRKLEKLQNIKKSCLEKMFV